MTFALKSPKRLAEELADSEPVDMRTYATRMGTAAICARGTEIADALEAMALSDTVDAGLGWSSGTNAPLLRGIAAWVRSGQREASEQVEQKAIELFMAAPRPVSWGYQMIWGRESRDWESLDEGGKTEYRKQARKELSGL